MGKIFVLMGKSATGKDTVFSRLCAMSELALQTVVGYTTRPIREGERDGREYFFVTDERRRELIRDGKVIESRTYHTMFGDWHYFTVDDGQVAVDGGDYLFISTIPGFLQLVRFFGKDRVIPFYIEVEDGVRLERSLSRERRQAKPGYEEVCRRFLADNQDFAEERLLEAGITKRYSNESIEVCVSEIAEEISRLRGE